MVISGLGYSLTRCSKRAGQGYPGYTRTQFRRVADQSYSASSQQGQSNSQGVLGLEQGDSSRLDASGALLCRRFLVSCTGLVRHQAHQRGLDYCHRNNWRDARIEFNHGTKMFFDIAIIGSTWLRLDREERRGGWVVRLFCSRYVECLVPLPRARAKAKVLNRSNC